MDEYDRNFDSREELATAIGRQILRAKKVKWFKEKEIEQNDREVILSQLETLFGLNPEAEFEEDKFEDLSDKNTPGGPGYLKVSDFENEEEIGLNQETKEALYLKVQAIFKQQQSQRNLKLLEVPDYLLCRISDELMENPVILESGFTYEKREILRHFQYNGNIDPLTREEVDPRVLIPNKNIKQAIQDFLASNPWAFEYIPGQTTADMKM